MPGKLDLEVGNCSYFEMNFAEFLEKAKKLETLKTDLRLEDILDSNPLLQLNTVKCLVQEDREIYLNSLNERIPNLESLKREEFHSRSGVYDKMTSLEVEELNL